MTDDDFGWMDDGPEASTEAQKPRKRDHSHLRANVEKRRLGYAWFLITAIVVFLVSVADILWLDGVLYWGVLGAYLVLFVWAVVLLFSRRIPTDEEEDDDDAFAPLEDIHAKGWREDGDIDHLRCPHCRHVFAFDMKDLHAERRSVAFTCPECGAAARLPQAHAPVHEAVVPGGPAKGPEFHCHSCEERWSVGAIGHDPKAEVRFDACPHCGSVDIGRLGA